ncbi:MAG: hypothetical protein ACREYF_27760 [Gammaproteobacteria bacterium]
MRFCAALFFILVLALPAAADVSDEMPDARAVVEGIRGEDDMDTVVRKQAAMDIMYAVIHARSIERATQRGGRVREGAELQRREGAGAAEPR